MKKLLTSFVLLFTFLAVPLSADAAKVGPGKYDTYLYDKAIKRVASSLKDAKKHVDNATKYYDLYVKKPNFITKRLAMKAWDNAASSLDDYANYMTIAIELNAKFSFHEKKTFDLWQLAHYKTADGLWAQHLATYRSFVYMQQLDSKLANTDIEAAIDDVNGELSVLTNRAMKGWLGIDKDAPGNIHTYIDTLLSPKFDRPVDVLSGYLVETTLTNIYADYFKGTALEKNKLLMSVPSAIGNTISPSSLRSTAYPYEAQIKLLAIQIQLNRNLDSLFGEITKEFNDYADYIKEKKKKQPAPIQKPKPEEDKEECTTLRCAFENV